MLTRYFYPAFVLLSALFFGWQGWFAINKIDFLEIRLYEIGIKNWYIAPVLTRILISVFFILSFSLLIHLFYSQRTLLNRLLFLPFSVIILEITAIVSGHNIEPYRWMEFAVFPFWTGLVFILIFFLWKGNHNRPSQFNKVTSLTRIILVAFFLSLPFIYNPVFPGDFSSQSLTGSSEIDLSELGVSPINSNTLFCFYTTSCPFCKRAAKKIFLSLTQEGRKRVHVFFMGDEEGVNYFWNISNVSFQYTIPPLEIFYKYGGNYWPQFLLVNNNRVLGQWDGRTFNYAELNRLNSLLTSE